MGTKKTMRINNGMIVDNLSQNLQKTNAYSTLVQPLILWMRGSRKFIELKQQNRQIRKVLLASYVLYRIPLKLKG